MSGAVQSPPGGEVLERDDTPNASEREPHPQPCLNCRAELTGPYCRQCGQSAHVHRTLAAVWHDLKHGVLHLDGKLARTLPLLALRPGELTRRYIAGERRAFVSPLAMFLFAVFALFLIMQLFHVQIGQINTDENIGAALLKAEMTLEKAAAASGAEEADLSLAGGVVQTRSSRAEVADRRERAQATLPPLREAMRRWGGEELATMSERSGGSDVPGAFRKLIADPGLALYKFQANSYKFSWALIPLSVPFVWLLFAGMRRFTIYDHTVFVTYSLAFATLLVSVLVVLAAAGVSNQLLTLGLLLAMPLHQLLQLRGAYHLRKRSALWRLLVLQVLIAVVLALFAGLIFGLGLL